MKFSIITGYYKGHNFLPELYNNLLFHYDNGEQFEWIIVDDYSNDGVSVNLIEKFKELAPFEIKSLYLSENHYGSRSVAEAVKIALGEYVVILDQDDFLTPRFFRILSTYIDKYEHVENFAGVCGRCTTTDGILIGEAFPWSEKLTNELEVRHIYKIRGEFYPVTRKEIVAEYFSDFKPGFTNGFAWTRIARKYNFVYINDVLRIYDTGNPASHSNSKKIRHIDGLFELYCYYLIANIDYLTRDIKFMIQHIVHCIRFMIHSNKPIKVITNNIPLHLSILVYLLYPIGVLFAKRDILYRRI